MVHPHFHLQFRLLLSRISRVNAFHLGFPAAEGIMKSVSSNSLQANKLCLILACASLLFLRSHVVAAVACSRSRLDVDRPGNSDINHAESVDGTSSPGECCDAAAVVPEYERLQNFQSLLRRGASKHSIYLMKAGRKLVDIESPSPPSPDGPTAPPGPIGLP